MLAKFNAALGRGLQKRVYGQPRPDIEIYIYFSVSLIRQQEIGYRLACQALIPHNAKRIHNHIIQISSKFIWINHDYVLINAVMCIKQ